MSLSWGRVALGYACTVVGMGALWYVAGDPTGFYEPFRTKYIAHLGTVWAHGVPAVIALLLGPWQFWQRRKGPLHRTLGLLYLVAVLSGAATGFEMGLMAFGGLSSRIGFCLMAALWFGTALMAWRAARLRQFDSHARWMRRNFALTFGAVMLRVYLTLLQGMGLDFFTVYPYVTWLAWVPNLIGVELLSSSRAAGAATEASLLSAEGRG